MVTLHMKLTMIQSPYHQLSRYIITKYYLGIAGLGTSSRLELLTLSGALAGGLTLLRQQDGLDVWQHTSLSDGDPGQEFVELLIVPDGELEVTRDDSGLLVVPSSVTGQLEHLSGKVLHNCSQVHWSSGSHSLSIVTLPQEPVNPADWELQASSAGPGLRLSLHFSSFAAARHLST